jgi:hypothetical protein
MVAIVELMRSERRDEKQEILYPLMGRRVRWMIRSLDDAGRPPPPIA